MTGVQTCALPIYDMDEYVAAFEAISQEAYTDPELVKGAPYKAALGARIEEECLTDWSRFATTWRAYKRMEGEEILC